MYDDLVIPPRIARLRRDSRGVIVPWFVAWTKDGEEVHPDTYGAAPDFRALRAGSIDLALQKKLCWVCGEPTGVHRVFAIGPMCVVNRVTMEPPSHRTCAEFSARACPFLVKPRMRRIPWGELEGKKTAPGMLIERNPGCVCLYETDMYMRVQDGMGGKLIRLGNPTRIDWWAQGRQATRTEVLDSIDSGFPLLENVAKKEGTESVAELMVLREQAMKYLPG
jgi:hypothetical protein